MLYAVKFERFTKPAVQGAAWTHNNLSDTLKRAGTVPFNLYLSN
jgi:hypothetical protein